MKFRILLYFLLLYFAISSCDNDVDTLPLGKEILKPTTRLMTLDTFSVEMSTGALDSIITSGDNILLVGACTEPVTGKIISKSYFQIGLPSSYSILDNEIFDSLTLSLSYTGYSLGDTTSPQPLTVHKLTDEYNPDNRKDFFNTDSLNFDYSPVGSITYLPRPGSDNKLEIKMDDLIGTDIFNFLKENDADLTTNNDFLNLIQGFALVPDISSGSAIVGFHAIDTNLFLKVYTHVTDLEENSRIIKLPLTNKEKQFNQISCDWRNNPAFINHYHKNDVASSLTGNKAYVIAGLGLFTKILMPTLPRILEFENCTLIRAILYFEPEKGSYGDLPDASKLRLYRMNKHNDLESLLINDAGNELSPTLNMDEFYDEDTYYSFDITYYLSAGVTNHYLDPDQAIGIGFSSASIAHSFERIVLECNRTNLNKPRLELLLLYYDQN